MTMEGLITHDNITLFDRLDAKTVILDAASGEIMPHFVEIDAISPDEPMTIIQPASPLRYVSIYCVLLFVCLFTSFIFSLCA
jgi:hypothetical protein